ncbi:SpoIIE family protein phosphatase [Spongiactinospora sp. TRM90649]|uniref:PP2C family protein-serine/threonine phosphatase n=1 Tax=Spongiactinospora sp. TRM90649 TaxID=3031114 RepID=UPI0023F67836|nr:SpoIIE family protein phosphatase [Spongiactinospora sp. TRM90649]MDF5758130.1 SpoIIE family protein phosphatase [Spongiactinospora sp. TRM90649]
MSAGPYDGLGGSHSAGELIGEQLERLRTGMRREAVVDAVTCELAARMEIRPREAFEYLTGLSRESGVDVLDVALSMRGGEPPVPEEARVEVPHWVWVTLDVVHVSACYLLPIRDRSGRVVDFHYAAVSPAAVDVTGSSAHGLLGRRLTMGSPGSVRSGLYDAFIRVMETGEPMYRGPFEYVEIMEDRLWPASITARAVPAGDGLLVSWRTHDDEERLVAGWERAQRIAELGWGEWNLATGRIRWTRQMYEIFGREDPEGPLPIEEFPGQVVPEDRGVVDEGLRTLLEYREAAETEFRVMHRHGIRHVRMVSEPVLDSEGLLIAIRVLALDVTASRRRERALAAAHSGVVRARRRAEEERRVAVRLQDSILPIRRGTIDLPGLTVGLRYYPGEEVDRLGGDWYKAREMPDGHVLLAIGDAMGHGLTAASLMAQMRSGLAGLAYTGASADRLTTWLNELIYHSTAGITATGTAIVGHFAPATHVLAWACAGHPAPVLVREGTAVLLPVRPGPLLGAERSAEYELESTVLQSGDLVILYTDGIVERRGRDIEEGIEALLAAARSAGPGEDPERVLDHLLTELLRDERTEDDICVLAIRVL